MPYFCIKVFTIDMNKLEIGKYVLAGLIAAGSDNSLAGSQNLIDCDGKRGDSKTFTMEVKDGEVEELSRTPSRIILYSGSPGGLEIGQGPALKKIIDKRAGIESSFKLSKGWERVGDEAKVIDIIYGGRTPDNSGTVVEISAFCK
jgi:hypothetical protein